MMAYRRNSLAEETPNQDVCVCHICNEAFNHGIILKARVKRCHDDGVP